MKHKRRRKNVRQETQGTTAGLAPAAGGRDAPSPADIRLHQAIEEFQGDRVDQALRLCQEILVAEPDHVDALNLAATITYRMGDSERTISLLKAVAAVQPNNAEAHSSLGDVLRWMQRSEEAVAAYRRALEIAPGVRRGALQPRPCRGAAGEVRRSRGRLPPRPGDTARPRAGAQQLRRHPAGRR